MQPPTIESAAELTLNAARSSKVFSGLLCGSCLSCWKPQPRGLQRHETANAPLDQRADSGSSAAAAASLLQAPSHLVSSMSRDVENPDTKSRLGLPKLNMAMYDVLVDHIEEQLQQERCGLACNLLVVSLHGRQGGTHTCSA